jgi:hypothetical protein
MAMSKSRQESEGITKPDVGACDQPSQEPAQQGATEPLIGADIHLVSDLIRARLRLDQLEQDLSDALNLLYGILALSLDDAPTEVRSKVTRSVRFKLFQLPQGCRIGRRLIELDQQSGCLLESKGIWLECWVYEPREKANG